MKITALKNFAYSHNGIHLTEYIAGQSIDSTDDEMVAVAVREGWAEVPIEKAVKPPSNKAHKAAPESK
jgi:hypothetical protein